MSIVIIGAVISLLIYLTVKYYRFVFKYPLGPFPYPFIGQLGQMDFTDKLISQWAKSFNGVYTIFTPIPIVELSTFEAFKEAYVDKGDDFSGRPQNKIMEETFSFAENAGVINSYGDNWREQRRTALSIMRDFGMGKNIMEELVRNSCEEYLNYLKQAKNKDNIDMRWPIQLMVANIINEVMFGYRFKYDDCDELVAYVEDFNKFMQDIASSKTFPLAMICPQLKYVPVIGWYIIGKHKENNDRINKYIIKHVAKALESYHDDSEPTCFVHAYKKRMANNLHLNLVQLQACCADFFLAGQETTTTTLRWAMLLLAKYPEIQEKLRQEIHCVVGKERIPQLSDKAKMIYTQACIHEIQRYSNIIITTMLHRSMRDTSVQGHDIPIDTIVHGDINYIHMNDPIFVDPHEFRPERYISDDGNTLRKDVVERTIPFSIGKRSCAGEGLARVELFIGLAATIQHYRILPNGRNPIDLTPRKTTFSHPQQQTLRLEEI